MLRERVRETPVRDAFYAPHESGWLTHTWEDVEHQVRPIAAGLRALSVQDGDRVGLLCSTRVEWLFIDLAINTAAAATTTIYPSSTPADVEFITHDSGSVIVFAEDDQQVAKFQERRDGMPHVRHVINIDGAGSLDGWVIALPDLVALGDAYTRDSPAELDAIIDRIGPDDLATLIYTSGTTGRPKGVMLTNDCWSYIAESLRESDAMREDDVQYLWLPLSHVFGKMLEIAVVSVGIPTAVDGRIPNIIDNLAEIQPTFMAAAPRIFEKVYNKIISGAQEGGWLKVQVLKGAMEVGREVSKIRQAGKEPGPVLATRYKLFDTLVFSKIRAKFGGKIRFFISGSAPLNRDIAEFFHAAGLLILEGYGLTESSAASFVNLPEQNRFGTVGPPLPGTALRLADDGEILLQGRGIMKGYFNRPEATAKTLVDGWLHTGDIGELDGAGHLRITDRKKALIKTSGGKYVAPSAIEGRFKATCPYVSQIVVHGDRRNYCSALVTMDEETILKWASDNRVSGTYAELSRKPKVIALFQDAFDTINAELGSWETIKKFQLLPEDFTPENGLLTPSLKVKRRAVEAVYESVLNEFYADTIVSV
jgi:long-chain acyl-CoA synthetase